MAAGIPLRGLEDVVIEQLTDDDRDCLRCEPCGEKALRIIDAQANRIAELEAAQASEADEWYAAELERLRERAPA